jgi:hypothetical protein
MTFMQADVQLIGAKVLTDYFRQLNELTAGTGTTVDWPATVLQILEDLQEATYMTCLTLQVLYS